MYISAHSTNLVCVCVSHRDQIRACKSIVLCNRVGNPTICMHQSCEWAVTAKWYSKVEKPESGAKGTLCLECCLGLWHNSESKEALYQEATKLLQLGFIRSQQLGFTFIISHESSQWKVINT